MTPRSPRRGIVLCMEAGGLRHWIAVIRVEVGDGAGGGLLIELLEVGPERGADIVVGRATDPAQAGILLERRLRKLERRRSQT